MNITDEPNLTWKTQEDGSKSTLSQMGSPGLGNIPGLQDLLGKKKQQLFINAQNNRCQVKLACSEPVLLRTLGLTEIK